MSNHNEILPYRTGVGIVLINRENKIFVGKRLDSKSENWQMPQGGIDSGETPIEAVKREILEETGTDKIEIIKETKYWLYYDVPEYLASKFWQGKYRGQQQKWFLARFLGVDEDFNLSRFEPEFAQWKWVDKNELIELVVHFKKQLYIDIVNEFEHYLK